MYPKVEVLHSLGFLVSTKMTIQMVSSAYKNPATFQALLELIRSDSQALCFSFMKVGGPTNV